MTSLSDAIARAFQLVSSCPEYREKWITASDWAAVISKEYDVPFEAVGPTIASHFEKLLHGETIHQKVVAAAGNHGASNTTFYSVTSNGSKPKEDAEYYNVKNDTVKHCTDKITPQVRFQLLSVLIPEIEKQRGLVTIGAGDKRPAPSSGNNKATSNKRRAVAVPLPPMGFPQVIPPMIPPALVLQEAARRAMPLPTPPKPKPKFKVSEQTMSKRAVEIEKILGDDAATRDETLRILLKRRTMEGAREALEKTFRPPAVENAIANGIHDFIEYHRGAGSRVKHEQDAIDAVMTAVCFSPSCENHLTHIGHRIDARSTKQVKEYRARAKEMKQHGTKFQPKVRKKRKDCWREDAIKCVRDFIHSDEMSHLDTRAKARVYKVEHPMTKEKESHPARIWNESGSQATRHQAFLESAAYAEFQKSGKTISSEVFRLGLCKCIHEPASAVKAAPLKTDIEMAWEFE